jgi:hypothetical protein
MRQRLAGMRADRIHALNHGFAKAERGWHGRAKHGVKSKDAMT